MFHSNSTRYQPFFHRTDFCVFCLRKCHNTLSSCKGCLSATVFCSVGAGLKSALCISSRSRSYESLIQGKFCSSSHSLLYNLHQGASAFVSAFLLCLYSFQARDPAMTYAFSLCQEVRSEGNTGCKSRLGIALTCILIPFSEFPQSIQLWAYWIPFRN